MSSVRFTGRPVTRATLPVITEEVAFARRDLRLVSSQPAAPRPLFGAGSRYPIPPTSTKLDRDAVFDIEDFDDFDHNVPASIIVLVLCLVTGGLIVLLVLHALMHLIVRWAS